MSRMSLEAIGARFVNLVLDKRESIRHILSLRCEWRSNPDYCHEMLAEPGWAGCALEKSINIGPLLEDTCCENCWRALEWRSKLSETKRAMTKLKRSIR